MRRFFAAALALCPAAASAHHVAPGGPAIEPWGAACLAVSVSLYAVGATRLWRRAGMFRGISRGDALRFAAGWLLLCAALLPPLDAMGERSFAAHMVQHETLMVVAAPLLVLGRPFEAWTWALAPEWRARLALVTRSRAMRATWGALTEPVVAWTLHATALWTWHIPALFEAAVASTPVHVAQHTSFLVTALFFWWTVFERSRHHAGATSMASVFTTMGHSGALGALLTFGSAPWYPSYPGAYGLTALEDQQLGGVLMWGPASFAYLVAALVIASRWLLSPRRIAG